MNLTFVHIPKTGGTSLFKELSSWIKPSIQFCNKEAHSYFANISSLDLQKYSLIGGHIPLSKFRDKEINGPAFTIVRDPEQRLVSTYRFLNRSNHTDHRNLKFSSLDHYIEYKLKTGLNSQCKFISNTEFFFDTKQVLLNENILAVPIDKYEQFIEYLRDNLPFPFQALHENRSPQIDHVELTELQKKRIENLICEDKKLYQYVLKNYCDLESRFANNNAKTFKQFCVNGIGSHDHKKETFKVSIIGGSNSLMKLGYAYYLQGHLRKQVKQSLEFKSYAVGGVPSLYGAIQNVKSQVAENSDVIFFEYCLNDRVGIWDKSHTLKLSGVALEGFIRSTKKVNPKCKIIILIFGNKQERYYNNFCFVSSLYESIASRYDIPVINVTEILLKNHTRDFICSLFADNAHYSKDKGVQLVAKLIIDEINKGDLLNNNIPLYRSNYYRIFPDNLQDLKYYDSFDFNSQNIQGNFEKSVFKNSLFKENILTLESGSKIEFSLKGYLVGIVLKCDWYDGIMKVELGDKSFLASAFSGWVKEEKLHRISLMSLPYLNNFKCLQHQKLTISVCEIKPVSYELGWNRIEPKVHPNNWKISIIGLAYLGELLD